MDFALAAALAAATFLAALAATLLAALLAAALLAAVLLRCAPRGLAEPSSLAARWRLAGSIDGGTAGSAVDGGLVGTVLCSRASTVHVPDGSDALAFELGLRPALHGWSVVHPSSDGRCDWALHLALCVDDRRIALARPPLDGCALATVGTALAAARIAVASGRASRDCVGSGRPQRLV